MVALVSRITCTVHTCMTHVHVHTYMYTVSPLLLNLLILNYCDSVHVPAVSLGVLKGQRGGGGGVLTKHRGVALAIL